MPLDKLGTQNLVISFGFVRVYFGYSGTEGASSKIILDYLNFSLATSGSLLDHSEMQGGSSWITYDPILPRSWHFDRSLASVEGIVALSFPLYLYPELLHLRRRG